MNIKKMALLAMYTTIALTIFIIEAALPPILPIPGVKLGLANIVTLWVLLQGTRRDALLVLFMRILIASVFAGQMVSFAYSLSGGLLCFLAMALLLYFPGKNYIVFISIAGALFHNIGQIIMAFLILQSFSILTYLPVLLISGIVTGTFTGLATRFMAKHMDHISF